MNLRVRSSAHGQIAHIIVVDINQSPEDLNHLVRVSVTEMNNRRGFAALNN